MAWSDEIQGFDEVMRNLNEAITGIQGRSMQGLIEANIIIRRSMDEVPPLIPVDTGNLRASYFSSEFWQGRSPYMTIGFNANYAVFVHEMIPGEGEDPINWSRPDSGAKFFQAALERNHQVILDTIQKYAKVR